MLRRTVRRRVAGSAAVIAYVAALMAASLGAAGAAGTTGGLTSRGVTVPPSGGTVNWAEAAYSPPNWIFPFAPIYYDSVANLTQFQQLMFRPLYWFGQVTSADPTFDESLSLADTPVWSSGDRTVTIRLKGWKWSDGTTVGARSVMFWLNMLVAEKMQYGNYEPGGIPDNIKSYSADATTDTVTLNLTRAYSTNWYLYNELSQITPMPTAWDITKVGATAGSGGCSTMTPTKTTASACAKVWTFLTDNGGKSTHPAEAADLATYGTNPLWQVVDGPWQLESFSIAGKATFVPNAQYSGPQHPYLDKFVEVPYASDVAEFDALAAGGPGAPDVGYIPSQDVPQNDGGLGSVGKNNAEVSSDFTLVPVYGWTINYFPENFNSNGDDGNAGPIFKQLYFRQALQDLVDQTGIIHSYEKGYGVPTYGPVPIYPKNSFVSKSEAKNKYPYSLANAENLLTSHGWTLHPGGISVCKIGSKCGAGITDGAELNFTELYAEGTELIQQTVDAEASAWDLAGIKVSLKGTTFDNVLTTAVPCDHKQADCSWEFANWGGGWLYSPDYLPTGEDLLATGASNNYGSYSNATTDRLIEQTTLSSSLSFLTQYENYVAHDLPVVWQPNGANAFAEVSDKVGGVTPINALLNLTPEYWYFKA
ncbi:MAG: ABC transporter substrate-binding protein [Acidimicrobiales bacterium]